MKNTTCDASWYSTCDVCNILCYLKTSARNKKVLLRLGSPMFLLSTVTDFTKNVLADQHLQAIEAVVWTAEPGCAQHCVRVTWWGQNIVRRRRELLRWRWDHPPMSCSEAFYRPPLYFSSSQVHQHQRRCPEKKITLPSREFIACSKAQDLLVVVVMVVRAAVLMY